MNWTPTRKVTYSTVGGAMAALTIGTVGMVWPAVEFPPGYEAGLATVLTAAIGYVTRDAR